MVDKKINVSTSTEETLSMRGLKILKKIGEGSYANVFLAISKSDKDKNSQTKLACKIIDATKAPKDFIKKFLPRELNILLKISHPHIVHIHSIFQRGSKHYIVMRYAERGDLLQHVLTYGPVPEEQARVWTRQIALAVQYLHEMNVVHRDLKCENILLTANQNTKLSDFGFARFCVDAKKKSILSSTYCGSLSYAAPEVIKGSPYVPKGADIWSLGVLLYVMLNKSMPFDDTNIKKLYDLQMKRKWKFRSKVSGLSDQCRKLVKSMMEPSVDSRISIDQVVSSEWIIMDSRFQSMSTTESAALEKAKKDKNNSEFFDKVDLPSTSKPNTASLRVLKENTTERESKEEPPKPINN